ncbi:RNA polymerase sigma factor [Microbispora sp. CA-135349]|uniref:RNA polymerase sigma factor n=1 Tax=Microbispora sp. CA-135349 TaxID=3239953 RepID=UPI003D8D9D35
MVCCDRHEDAGGIIIEELYREHWALVCGFLLRRTRDPHLAEDLAQETFVKATRALLGWRGENLPTSIPRRPAGPYGGVSPAPRSRCWRHCWSSSWRRRWAPA